MILDAALYHALHVGIVRFPVGVAIIRPLLQALRPSLGARSLAALRPFSSMLIREWLAGPLVRVVDQERSLRIHANRLASCSTPTIRTHPEPECVLRVIKRRAASGDLGGSCSSFTPVVRQRIRAVTNFPSWETDMRAVSLAAILSAALSAPLFAIPTPRGTPIQVTCGGAVSAEGKQVAKANGLTLGQDPKACFGRMQIYDGNSKQFVVVAPSAGCPKGHLLDVYERANAGNWHSLFERPVCGSTVSIGPKDPWGDWMLTIDRKHYDSKGAFYVPVSY
jgi:hypothetical protein